VTPIFSRVYLLEEPQAHVLSTAGGAGGQVSVPLWAIRVGNMMKPDKTSFCMWPLFLEESTYLRNLRMYCLLQGDQWNVPLWAARVGDMMKPDASWQSLSSPSCIIPKLQRFYEDNIFILKHNLIFVAIVESEFLCCTHFPHKYMVWKSSKNYILFL